MSANFPKRGCRLWLLNALSGCVYYTHSERGSLQKGRFDTICVTLLELKSNFACAALYLIIFRQAANKERQRAFRAHNVSDGRGAFCCCCVVNTKSIFGTLKLNPINWL